MAFPPKLVIAQVSTSHLFASKSAFTLRVMPPAIVLRDKVLSPLADPHRAIADVIVSKRDCSKLACERNRARRRVEAAAREVLPSHACRDHVYLLRALRPALTMPWEPLVQDLEAALRQVRCFRLSPSPRSSDLTQASTRPFMPRESKVSPIPRRSSATPPGTPPRKPDAQ